LREDAIALTDPGLSAREILEGYSQRWTIEVCFRELKQLLGFADSSARKQAAVERTAPFVGIIYSVLILWAVDSASQLALSLVPHWPWYTHKRGLSFADILRAAQAPLGRFDVLDPASTYANLPKTPRRAAARSVGPLKRAA